MINLQRHVDTVNSIEGSQFWYWNNQWTEYDGRSIDDELAGPVTCNTHSQETDKLEPVTAKQMVKYMRALRSSNQIQTYSATSVRFRIKDRSI